MAQRNMSMGDIINVIRAGRSAPAEEENGAWRDRVLTNRMSVVLELAQDDDGHLVIVITAMRRTTP